jgi:hypothetical protein
MAMAATYARAHAVRRLGAVHRQLHASTPAAARPAASAFDLSRLVDASVALAPSLPHDVGEVTR